MPADPVPPAHAGRVVPYLMIAGAEKALAFYADAFGAVETMRLPMPDGTIGHAEFEIGGATFMIADSPDADGAASPDKLGGTTVMLHRYVPDCDAAYERAVSAGATGLRPPEDQFYGDRAATVQDPFGHLWSLHTHIRDVTTEELVEAMKDMPSG